MNFRSRLINLGLIVLGTFMAILLIFFIGETYFRLSIKADRSGSPGDFKVYNKSRGWALRPGEYSYFDFKAFRDVKISVNELGLRNQQISLSPSANRDRVTVLGDSFVFAAALKDGEHLTDQLQRLTDDRWEVVNVSVEGYGTGQQILLLKELIERGYEIGRHLVLVFFTNDVLDNIGLDYTGNPSPSKTAFSINEQGELEQNEFEDLSPRRASKSFLANWFFYSFLRSRVEIVLTTKPALLDFLEMFGLTPDLPRGPGIIAGWYSQGWEERWLATKDLLSYLVKFARNESPTRLSVLFIPSPFQVSDVLGPSCLINREKIQDIKLS